MGAAGHAMQAKGLDGWTPNGYREKTLIFTYGNQELFIEIRRVKIVPVNTLPFGERVLFAASRNWAVSFEFINLRCRGRARLGL